MALFRDRRPTVNKVVDVSDKSKPVGSIENPRFGNFSGKPITRFEPEPRAVPLPKHLQPDKKKPQNTKW